MNASKLYKSYIDTLANVNQLWLPDPHRTSFTPDVGPEGVKDSTSGCCVKLNSTAQYD